MNLSFFHFFAILVEKRQSQEKTCTREKIFDCEIFVLKYVSNHSKSVPTKTFFRRKNFFWVCLFFAFWAILAKKRQSPRKKFYKGKIFDFEIFGLKYVLKHSESIPTKKIFRQKFLTLSFFHYFGPFGQKTTES